jgi:esterase/lipase
VLGGELEVKNAIDGIKRTIGKYIKVQD